MAIDEKWALVLTFKILIIPPGLQQFLICSQLKVYEVQYSYPKYNPVGSVENKTSSITYKIVY